MAFLSSTRPVTIHRPAPIRLRPLAVLVWLRAHLTGRTPKTATDILAVQARRNTARHAVDSLLR